MITTDTVYQELVDHMQGQGGSFSQWYAGIATSAEQRLFNDHNVSKQNGQWAYRTARSENHAREVEKQLLGLGCDGGQGGGISPKMVYVYKKTTSTQP